ncbi:MAG: hypothetical protein RLZZ216_817 [Cyanobacteriota bacterium]|jgi:hypothetical protein
MADLVARLAGELTEYESSDNPVQHALLELYRSGDIYPDGIRDGQIVWHAITEAGHG